MADVKRDSEQQGKSAEQLDEELEEYLERMKEKNKDYKYTDGFTSENVDKVKNLLSKSSKQLTNGSQ